MSGPMIDAGGADFSLELKDNLTRQVASAVGSVVSDIQGMQKAFAAEIAAIQQSVADVGKGIRNLGLGAAAVGGASVLGFGQAVRAAGDFAETVNMFEATFKGQSDAVRQWAATYGEEVGRSEAQLLSFLAQSQNALVPLGFDRGEAAEMSKTLTKLAIDLASFGNLDDGDAIQRLVSAISGNTENLKKFSVVAGEAQIKAKALSLGFDPSNLTAYQKAMAIVQITIEGTKDAQGDAARTAEEYVNSVKRMRSELSRLNIAIGEPLKAAVTEVVQAIGTLVGKAADFVERFPVVAQIAGVGAIALTGLGIAAAGAVTGLGLLAGTYATLQGVSLAWLIKSHGLLGAAAIRATAFRTALTTAASATVAQGSSMAAAAQSGATLGSVFKGLFASLKSGLASLVKFATTGILTNLWTGFTAAARLSFTAVVAGFRGMANLLVAGSAKLLTALTNPWVALAAAIAAATALAIAYYKNQERQEQNRAVGLERQRQEIVAKNLRDNGFAVPADLGATLDPNKARVVSRDPTTGQISKAEQELGKQITSYQTESEKFAETMRSARRLLERGVIDQGQFDDFRSRETQRFRDADPANQQRQSLIESLMTPAERLSSEIDKARELLGDTVLFDRARQAAIEQFKANDAATQLAKQLRTPLEIFNDATAEARKTFADSPENLKRALDAAAEQFRLADPVTQLAQSLQTPVERFAGEMARLKEVVAQADPADRAELLRRGTAAAQDRLNSADPDRQRAEEFRDSLKTEGEKLAEQITAISDLFAKGLLTEGERDDAIYDARRNAIGDRPEARNLSESIQATNSRFASQIGAFAPTIETDKQMLEFEKRKAKINRDMLRTLKRIEEKEGVLE